MRAFIFTIFLASLIPHLSFSMECRSLLDTSTEAEKTLVKLQNQPMEIETFIETISNAIFHAALIQAVEKQGEWIVAPSMGEGESTPPPKGDRLKIQSARQKDYTEALAKKLYSLDEAELRKTTDLAVQNLKDFLETTDQNLEEALKNPALYQMNIEDTRAVVLLMQRFKGLENVISQALFSLIKDKLYFRVEKTDYAALKKDNKRVTRTVSGVFALMGAPMVHLAHAIAGTIYFPEFTQNIADNYFNYYIAYCAACGLVGARATIGQSIYSIGVSEEKRLRALDQTIQDNVLDSLEEASAPLVLKQKGEGLLLPGPERSEKQAETLEFRKQKEEFAARLEDISSENPKDLSSISGVMVYGESYFKALSEGSALLYKTSEKINQINSEILASKRELDSIFTVDRSESLSKEQRARIDRIVSNIKPQLSELAKLQEGLLETLQAYKDLIDLNPKFVQSLNSALAETAEPALRDALNLRIRSFQESSVSSQQIALTYENLLSGNLIYHEILSSVERQLEQHNLRDVLRFLTQ